MFADMLMRCVMLMPAVWGPRFPLHPSILASVQAGVVAAYPSFSAFPRLSRASPPSCSTMDVSEALYCASSR